jgi:N-acetylmuramoyl-L-alanine amidase
LSFQTRPRDTDHYTVCIDPGHGGSDPGAVAGTVYEKTLNLNIALAMRNYLQGISSPYPTFTVIMTRSTDVDVTLSARCNIANNGNADIFVSIHCNTAGSSSTRGTTARYPNNHDTALSENLANSMIQVITPSPFPKHSDAAYQNLQVLRDTTMPAALVECGFMTNSTDLNILQTDYSNIGYYLGLAANVWCQVNV